MSLETFLSEWCWPGPYRSVGTPHQAQYSYHDTVDLLAELITREKAPIFVSTNPYNEAGEVEVIVRILYDFDNKTKPRLAWDDAHAFIESLVRYYGIGAITNFSGKKGYHIYIWLQQPVEGPPEHLKNLYKAIRGLFIRGHKYPTLDAGACDVTRLARVPFSKHQDTGALCVPVDPDLKPYLPAPGFSHALRKNGISPELVKIAERQLHRPQAKRRGYRGPKGRIRPCIEADLGARSVHEGTHLMRVAAVAELAAEGHDAEDITTRFSKMDGFNEARTRYFVEHAIRRGYRPFKCSTIQEIGGCLGSICPIYKGPIAEASRQEMTA
jgi:hypothetical protein